MKFAADRPFADPDNAACKLVELANAAEADRDQRIAIELINLPFLRTGGSVDEYRAGIERAIKNGWLVRHESGTFVKSRRLARTCSPDGERVETPFRRTDSTARGRQLVTLKDAPKYIQKLPAAEQQIAEWQAAVEALLLVVELNGPTMTARISVTRALNRGYVREFDSSRKDTH